MATERALRAGVLLLAAAAAGCTVTGGAGAGIDRIAHLGFVYTHQTRPLMTNFDATPVAADSGSNNVKTFTVQSFDVAWGKEGIGAIALGKGIAEVYYADLETTRVLGFFTRERVRVYGRAAESPVPSGVAYPVDDDTGQ
jgi:hypothetical protein